MTDKTLHRWKDSSASCLQGAQGLAPGTQFLSHLCWGDFSVMQLPFLWVSHALGGTPWTQLISSLMRLWWNCFFGLSLCLPRKCHLISSPTYSSTSANMTHRHTDHLSAEFIWCSSWIRIVVQMTNTGSLSQGRPPPETPCPLVRTLMMAVWS